MGQKRLQRLRFVQTIGTILLVLSGAAQEVAALERWLVPNSSQCASNITTNPCHLTLQDAVTKASPGDSIKILAGAYPANVTITTKNITIYGEETARTFLDGNGSTALTVSAVTALMDIRNITFIDASVGIVVSNASSQVNIKNNVFEVGNTATAIQVLDTSSPSIVNNSFYQNGTAILSVPPVPPSLSIINNIFSGNATAISTNASADNIQNNLFWPSTTIVPTAIIFNPGDLNYKGNVNNIDIDALFVDRTAADITGRDFHLISKPTVTGNTSAGPNSINGVSPPDVGAYGGSSSDTIPFPVSGLSGTAPSGASIDLTWNLNNCYMVTGYNIYYSLNRSGPPYDNATSPTNAGIPASFPYSLTVTLPSASILATPANLKSSPGSGTLTISWDMVDKATGYEVTYKKSTDTTFSAPLFVTTPAVILAGLTNPTPDGVATYYDVSIRAYYQTTFYLAVKDYYAPNSPPASNPKEALAFSNEVIVSLGTPTFSPAATIQDFPEPLILHPNLPNTGCFIATAAYGSYSASQVQALRKFRNQHLLTNAVGRAFVRWYYTYGPIGAQFLNEHPGWKPVARIALIPAVGAALFLTHTSIMTKVVSVMIISTLIVLALSRKKLLRSGGLQ